MSMKALRGTKRVCQSDECSQPFYDLNRSDIVCPNCGTIYVPRPVRALSLDQVRLAPIGRRPGRPNFAPTRAVEPEEPAEEVEVELEVSEDDIGDDADVAVPAVPETILETDDETGGEIEAPRAPINDD